MWMMPFISICLEEGEVVYAFQVSASKFTSRSEENYAKVPLRSYYVNLENSTVVVKLWYLCTALVQYNLLH